MPDDTEKQLYAKTLMGFQPVSEPAAAFHRKLGLGEIVELPGVRPRNVKHHRKFFAMLKIIFENQDYFKSMDHLLAACKLATGHADVIRTKQGDVFVPKSISFANMKQGEFEDFYDRAVQWATTDVIAGLDKKHLDDAVAELLRF